jgi:cyanophycinase-like exopeptidase
MRRWRRGMTRRFAEAVPDGVTLIGVDEHTAIVTDDLENYEVYGAGTAVMIETGSAFGPGDRFTI